MGLAYHAGVLLALELGLNWDVRTSDVIVGSSAGALSGALLRAGLRAEDVAALLVDAPFSVEAHDAEPFLRPRPVVQLPRLAHLASALRPPRPSQVMHTLLQLGRTRPAAAVAGLLQGPIDIGAAMAPLRSLTGDAWPQRRLWVIAVRGDGHRVVFGSDPNRVPPLSRAVAASCAIPGVFAPVRINGVRYVDGGAHSPTNADVLVRAGVDLAIISSPMSAAPGHDHGRVDARVRRLFHRWLERETNRLHRRGIETVVFEPTAPVLQVMGFNALADNNLEHVVREAFLAAGNQLTDDAVAEHLRPLQTPRALAS
jgi:NTE family protein